MGKQTIETKSWKLVLHAFQFVDNYRRNKIPNSDEHIGKMVVWYQFQCYAKYCSGFDQALLGSSYVNTLQRATIEAMSQ
jgi:hypothetical protein